MLPPSSSVSSAPSGNSSSRGGSLATRDGSGFPLLGGASGPVGGGMGGLVVCALAKVELIEGPVSSGRLPSRRCSSHG